MIRSGWTMMGSLVLIAGMVALSSGTPREDAAPSHCDTVLERAGAAVAAGVQRRADWSDLRLESSLAALLVHLREVTKTPNLALPVALDSVHPEVPEEGSTITFLRNGLFVAERVDIAHADHSIVLAGDHVEISNAKNCIIIASRTANIGHSSGCWIIAGHYIHVSHDGDRPSEDSDVSRGSVLISGSVIDVSHARNTVIGAPSAVTVGHANDVTFIDSPNRRLGHESRSTLLAIESAVLPNPRHARASIEGFGIAKIVPPDDAGRGARVVMRKEAAEIELRVGDEIRSDANDRGGWKLHFVGAGFALFEREGRAVGVRLAAE